MGNFVDTLFLGAIGVAKKLSESSSYVDKDKDDYGAGDYAIKYGAKAYDKLEEATERLMAQSKN